MPSAVPLATRNWSGCRNARRRSRPVRSARWSRHRGRVLRSLQGSHSSGSRTCSSSRDEDVDEDADRVDDELEPDVDDELSPALDESSEPHAAATATRAAPPKSLSARRRYEGQTRAYQGRGPAMDEGRCKSERRSNANPRSWSSISSDPRSRALFVGMQFLPAAVFVPWCRRFPGGIRERTGCFL